MVDSANTLKNRMQSFGNQVSEATANAMEGASAIAEDVGNKAKEFVADATQRAEAAGAYISQRADDATVAVGERLKMAGDASARMGRTLKETGDYVEREGFEGLISDTAGLIRRNPISAMLVGVGLGFVAARALYSRD